MTIELCFDKLAILSNLADGFEAARGIVSPFQQAAVHKHMRELRTAGLVSEADFITKVGRAAFKAAGK